MLTCLNVNMGMYLDATKLETPRATPGERPKLSISIIFPLQL